MVKAVLDKQFQPMALVVRDFLAAAEKASAQDIAISIKRDNGHISTFKTKIFKDGTGHDDENFKFIERLTKSLLWVRGGWKIVIGGSNTVAFHKENSAANACALECVIEAYDLTK